MSAPDNQFNCPSLLYSVLQGVSVGVCLRVSTCYTGGGARLSRTSYLSADLLHAEILQKCK